MHNYSPNNLLTLFITLSFSGSYGWSLLGISNRLGKASLYASTFPLILSAIYPHVSTHSIQTPHMCCRVIATYMLIDQNNRDILALPGEGLEGALDGGVVGFGVDDEEVFLGVGGVGDVLIIVYDQHRGP